MDKLIYLEDLCQTKEPILIDTNIIFANVSGEEIIWQLYDSKNDLFLDKEKVNQEIEYLNKLVGLITKYNNIFITKGILSENSELCRILNESQKYHQSRIYSQMLFHKKKKTKKHYHKFNRKDPEDIEYEKGMLNLLENYANSVFRILKILEEKIIKEDNNFDEILSMLKYLSKKYRLKKKSRFNQYKKDDDNDTDERFVANAFCLSLKSPINLVTTDGDIVRLCDSLRTELSKKATLKKFKILKYPIYLHTLPPRNPSEKEPIRRTSFMIYSK